MIVLGIESSCDETAASVVRDGHEVLSSVVASQIEMHAGYGGVVPELAAREHLRAIDVVVAQALAESGCSSKQLDGVAVTSNPGLIPALLVGVSFAKGMAVASGAKFLGVNHFIAHIFGAFLEQKSFLADAKNFPLLTLVVSGGHTALVLIQKDGKAEVIGTTIDDAAGEAFDKAAKILQLGYPGGPIIDRLSARGNAKAYDYPQALLGRGGKALKRENLYNFSFSGVKTAMLYSVRGKELSDEQICDVCASYQRSIVDVLVTKSLRAAKDMNAPTVVLCGGVACNSGLRSKLAVAGKKAGCNVIIAPAKFCTDNAVMVAGLADYYFKHNLQDDFALSVKARLPYDLGAIPFAPEYNIINRKN